MILKPRPFRKPRKGHWALRGLVSLWLMNEGVGDKIFDLSDNGNIGTFTGTAPAWNAGQFGSVLDLPGTNEYADCGDIDELDSVSVFSMVAWFRRRATDQNCLVGKSTDGDNRVNMGFSGNSIFFTVSNGSEAEGSFVLDDAEWHHCVMIYNGNLSGNANRLKGFINGEQKTLNFGATTIPATTANHTGNFRIGSLETFGTFTNGFIDNVSIYNRTLSDTEIEKLYRNPFIMFDRDPIELWVGSVGAAAPAGIVILRRRREGY